MHILMVNETKITTENASSQFLNLDVIINEKKMRN